MTFRFERCAICGVPTRLIFSRACPHGPVASNPDLILANAHLDGIPHGWDKVDGGAQHDDPPVNALGDDDV